jgi:FMN phosphatase YigB (HAD superfamily)
MGVVEPSMFGIRDAGNGKIFRNGYGEPVVGLDIDGTLGDYHGHFLKFAEGWLGRSLPAAEDINPGLRLSDHMGIPHDLYRKIKLAYRQGGLKRSMPAYEGAADLTHELRQAGVRIWICTTRPYNKLDNIDPDTQEWLERNRITYHHILFDDTDVPNSKYGELARQVGPASIVAVADDLTEQLQFARQCGITNCYLRAQPYNLLGVNHTGLTRMMSMAGLHSRLMRDVDRWKANAK